MAQRGRDQVHAARRALWHHARIYGPAAFLTLAGFVVAYQFVDPAPPRHVVIATGGTDGAYYAYARRYRALFAREGIDLEVRATGGSVENLALLRDPTSGVDVAFVQGGVGREGDPTAVGTGDGELVALASLYREPLWVFHRLPSAPAELRELRGRTLAVGGPGSGTRAIALELLRENGITERDATLEPLASEDAAEALGAGKVDAAFFVAATASGAVHGLLHAPGVSLMSFERADAYTRIHPFLSRVVLPRGSIDLAADVPRRDVSLLAPAATLVASPRLHPAIADLLLQAATRVHRAGGLFEDYGQFPSPKYVDFPLSGEARRFFESGPSLLQRYLPFWAATLVDRMLVMLLPVVALLLPLMRVMPPVYRWRMRARIYRWYRELLAVDPSLDPGTGEGIGERLEKLERIEREVSRVSVPMSFADQLYQLRVHIGLVRERLLGAAPPAPGPGGQGGGG